MTRMKTINLVAALLTATAVAGAVFRLAFIGADSPSGWRVLAGWVVAAVAWAAVFSVVREGVRPTFAHPVDELDLLPRSWREVLRSTCGVYLLTDEEGQQYVGSAKGAEGFLGRWQSYREGRAGGNLGLASHAVGRFRVTVLRTFDPSTPDITIEAEESAWKTKLSTRERGLNRN